MEIILKKIMQKKLKQNKRELSPGKREDVRKKLKITFP